MPKAKPPITGQIFIRETSRSVPDSETHKLILFVGALRVPKDIELKGEHQYAIYGETHDFMGDEINQPGIVGLNILSRDGAVDLNEMAAGYTLSQVMTSIDWRV